MAVKGYKIVESRQLVMICDDCGCPIPSGAFKFVPPSPCSITKDMVTADPKSSDYYYEYVCPHCGNIQKSKNSYPCQQIKFDYGDVVDIEDPGKM